MSMNRVKEIIMTVSTFIMVPVLLAIVLVPALIVSNLSPIVRKEDFGVERKNKTVLGTQSFLFDEVEVRLNDEMLNSSPVYNIGSKSLKLNIIHSVESKHTVFADSIFLQNRGSTSQKIYVIPHFDTIPSDIEIATTIDNISNVMLDSEGNMWPQEIFLNPGEELLIGIRIDGRYEIHSDLNIELEIAVE